MDFGAGFPARWCVLINFPCVCLLSLRQGGCATVRCTI
ncbi:hypothetical protein H206_05314 [Candidatus Electrothrix aarhusensis]|uniref:Uncharacterized protein n=1 Tax=Candidatus Electrothrix aarhusensis TaxID=1859131 RepID=A0A3S3QIA5_9BACT|nr:hypothetical protein H206_05314 [Candidatus Electrothrix aarhusensis]